MQTKKKITLMTSQTLLPAAILLVMASILLIQTIALHAGTLANPKIVSYHWAKQVYVGAVQAGKAAIGFGSNEPSWRVLVLKIQADVSAGGAQVSTTSFRLLLKDSEGKESDNACELLAAADSPDPGVFGSFLYEKAGIGTTIKLRKGLCHFSLACLLPPNIESVQMSQDGGARGEPLNIGLKRPYSVCLTSDADLTIPPNLVQMLEDHGYQVIASKKKPPEMPGSSLGINLPGATLVFTGTTVYYDQGVESQASDIYQVLGQLNLSPMGVTTTIASPFDFHVHIAK